VSAAFDSRYLRTCNTSPSTGIGTTKWCGGDVPRVLFFLPALRLFGGVAAMTGRMAGVANDYGYQDGYQKNHGSLNPCNRAKFESHPRHFSLYVIVFVEFFFHV
jgi:hypothetical protein